MTGRGISGGENPGRQLSLQPEATGAVGNDATGLILQGLVQNGPDPEKLVTDAAMGRQALKFSEFQQKVREILKTELPPGRQIADSGREVASGITIGRTAFFIKKGVESEYAYKRQCIREKRIMYHAHMGMGSWRSTVEALVMLYNASTEAGFQVDRVGLCLDRRMALPQEKRAGVPAETGPTLNTPQEWAEIGTLVPIQPHMGDFMIGFPASTENTVHALKAGVTTIGNLSQFFSHEAPMWRDHVQTTMETVRAVALMGSLREKGTLVHSYLEDGFGALFHDCATIAGWALLERYIVEKLLGAKVAHCIGGLTTDPVKRAGWIFALNEIHDGDCVGSMFYGDTISFCEDFSVNRAMIAEYLIWDIMAQLECPTGHAVLPLPVTEFIRIPSAEEIVDAQQFGTRIAEAARRLYPYVDFTPSHDFAQKMVSAGKTVYQNSLAGLQESGVDIQDPVQILYVLKKLGPRIFEAIFGVGPEDDAYPSGRRPALPTDIFEMSRSCIERNRALWLKPSTKKALIGRKILIASTDVHEHAIMIIEKLVSETGAEIVYLGAEQNPDDIVQAACERKVDTILISTHNGMALDYARRLKSALEERAMTIPIIMGGVLNQKVEHHSLPVDVSSQLLKLGFRISPQLGENFTRLIAL